jgi:aconitate decarboxylase
MQEEGMLNTTSAARQLTDFIHGLSLDTLPGSVTESAKWCLLDTLGCALFGAEEAWARIMAEEMLAEASRE